MRDKLIYMIKSIEQMLITCSKRKTNHDKDILVLATRRGGSTMLMEIIYSQPGISFVAQPTDLWRYHPLKTSLPETPFVRFISLNEAEEKMMYDFFQSVVFAGKLRGHMPWRFWEREFSFFYNRLVVKVLNAKALIEWFSRNFDVHIVYLVRHPLAVASSIRHKGWGSYPTAFIEDKWFRETYLDGRLMDRCNEIINNGTELERIVLEWCLENLHPLRMVGSERWLMITYEELVLKPREMTDLLCTRLSLPNKERAYMRIAKPSMNATRGSREAMREYGSSRLITRWKQNIDSQTEAGLMTILSDFDIDIYQGESFLPASWACHFGDLDVEIPNM